MDERSNEIKTDYHYMKDLNLLTKGDYIVSEKMEDNTRLSKNINRNYDFLFSEKESIRIHKLVGRFYSQYEKGERIKSFATYLRLKFIEKVTQFYLETEEIWENINFLTSDINNTQNHKLILQNLQTYNSLVHEIKENNGIISIKTAFGEIKFSEITKFFPNLENDDDIKNMESRAGKCHYAAVDYSKRLKSIGIDNDVVTAKRCITADKIIYLHSWNEFKIDGKEHVLDYTQNVVMNKEGYYSLNHIQQIISRINCVDIENDSNIYKQIDNEEFYIDIKTYLTCRDEIIRDLQKNVDIFHDER